ncbi:MAG: protein kinase [Bryobacterales bacterium]|nr:protein kinase [Bryobacterales bacterium]
MTLTPGDHLGPYQILAPIGKGGMGHVYRAKDTRLDRVIAVKVLAPHLGASKDFQRRFELEARAISSLHHPHICTLFDVGDSGPFQYLVMEHLEGETMEDRLKRGPLPLPEALIAGRQILDALRHAHQKGILHRDLKPSNIFLLRNQQAPWTKLLDFGSAKIMDPRAPGAPDADQTEKLLTDPSHLIGTPLYMAPEVLQGQLASPRSDIHAAGAVLYEMLCGRRAFQADGRGNAIAAVLRDQPPLLSEIGVKGISTAVATVVMRCLGKVPDQRWQTMEELYVAWDHASKAEGGVERPQSAGSKLGRPAGRRIVLTMAALLSALLASAMIYWLFAVGSGTRSIAILPFLNTSGNLDMEYLGDGITESLINSLSRAPNLAVMPRNSIFRHKGRDIDAHAVGQALQVQTVLVGRVTRLDDALSVSVELIDVRDNRLLWGERYNRRVADMQAVQEEISTEISERLRIRLTGEDRKRLTKRYTQNAEAYQLYLRGRFHWNKKTPDGFTKGIEYLQQAIQADPNYAPAYAGLAALYNNLANYNFALIPPKDAWAKAKAAATRAIQIDDSLASAHDSLALGRLSVGMGLGTGRPGAQAVDRTRSRIALGLRAKPVFDSPLVLSLRDVDGAGGGVLSDGPARA